MVKHVFPWKVSSFKKFLEFCILSCDAKKELETVLLLIWFSYTGLTISIFEYFKCLEWKSLLLQWSKAVSQTWFAVFEDGACNFHHVWFLEVCSASPFNFASSVRCHVNCPRSSSQQCSIQELRVTFKTVLLFAFVFSFFFSPLARTRYINDGGAKRFWPITV